MFVSTVHRHVICSDRSHFTLPDTFHLQGEFTSQFRQAQLDAPLDMSKESWAIVAGIYTGSQHHVTSGTTETIPMSMI
jgi:hypothetical protein